MEHAQYKFQIIIIIIIISVWHSELEEPIRLREIQYLPPGLLLRKTI